MTELMKRPEDLRKSFYKKTGESPLVDFSFDCSDDSYFKPQKIEVPAIEYMKYLEHMVLDLKAQLRWRPVSEKPEKEGMYFARWHDDSQPVVLRYIKYVWFRYDYELGDYASVIEPKWWLPIPPQGEHDE